MVVQTVARMVEMMAALKADLMAVMSVAQMVDQKVACSAALTAD